MNDDRKTNEANAVGQPPVGARPAPPPPSGAASGSESFTDDPGYQAYVEECADKCTCTPMDHRPCDGVLAGGLCDDMHWDEDHTYVDAWEED